MLENYKLFSIKYFYLRAKIKEILAKSSLVSNLTLSPFLHGNIWIFGPFSHGEISPAHFCRISAKSLCSFPSTVPGLFHAHLFPHLLCDWYQNLPSAGPAKNKRWEGVCTHVWMWLSDSDGGRRQVVNIQPPSASDSSALLQTQHGAAVKSRSGWMLG